MSRIGLKPIVVPQGVKVNITPTSISVEGPKGKLAQTYNPAIVIEQKASEIFLTRKNDAKQTKAFHGLYRSLVNNMITGVSTGFTRALIITGVGYKAELRGKILVLNLGYSSEFGVAVPDGVSAVIEANGQKLVLSGHDRQKLGKFASEIRKLRAPEPYKGKGIRYEEEKIRKKVGKTGVK